MAVVSAFESLFNVAVDARPSNYLVNHINWPTPNEAINWSELRLLRKTSGHPQNINDGTTILSTTSQSIVLTVGAVYGANGVSTLTYTGGGTASLTQDYTTYTGVAQSATSGSGTGATFNVTRSRADGGSVFSVTVNCPGEGYAANNTITIPKASIGYSSTDTGPTDITVTVATVAGSTGAIKTVTVSSNTAFTPTASLVGTSVQVNGVSTGTSSGYGAVFNAAVVSTGVSGVTFVSNGASYKVNDVIRVPISSLGGRSATTVLGRTNDFHVFDTGASTGSTTNPGYGVTGTNLNSPRYYYSLFLKYTVDSSTTPVWRKIGEAASFAVTDRSSVDGRTTLSKILEHVPAFYKKDAYGNNNKDLQDFLSLFAFHIDSYVAASNSVFGMYHVEKVDEKLVKLMLQQFGSSYSDVSGLAQARTLLSNIVRNYQTSGTSTGLANAIEASTGYGVTLTPGKNLISDYNSASFIDGVGSWKPSTTATSSYATTAPYTSLLTQTPIGYGAPYSEFVTPVPSLGTATSTGTTVTITGSTGGLRPGMIIKVASGTGAVSTGGTPTLITSIIDSTSFKLNQAPTSTFSSAVLQVSSNMASGVGKVVNPSGAATYYYGRALSAPSTTYNAGVTTMVIKPFVGKVGDSVWSSSSNSIISPGTTISAVDTTAGSITLSKPLIGTVTTATVLNITPNGDGLAAHVGDLISVKPGLPYAFSVKAQCVSTGTTTVIGIGTVFYDSTGTLISTATADSGSAVTAYTSWDTVSQAMIAPLNAVAASPYFSVTAANSTGYYFDGVQFEGPLPVIYKSYAASATTATITTSTTHNYVVGKKLAVSGLGAPFDTGSTAASIISVVATTNTVTYAVNATSGTTYAESCTGYVASPTSFEDANKVGINIIANRRNLCSNPSFETNTTGWSVNNATIATSSAQAYANTYSGLMTVTATTSAAYAQYTVSSVTQNSKHSFSYYVYSDAANSADRKFKADAYSYNGSSYIALDTATAVTVTRGAWTRVTHTFTTSDSGGYTQLAVRVYPTTLADAAAPVGDKHYIDEVLIEESDVIDHYFDGAYDGQNYSADRDSMWEGTAHASVSHLYYNRVNNFGIIEKLVVDGMNYA